MEDKGGGKGRGGTRGSMMGRDACWTVDERDCG